MKPGDLVRLVDIEGGPVLFGMSVEEYVHFCDLEGSLFEIVDNCCVYYFDIKSVQDGRKFYGISRIHLVHVMSVEEFMETTRCP